MIVQTDYLKSQFCPDCGIEMEHTVDIEKDESSVRRYHTWRCPKCDHIHEEEQA